MAVSIYQKLKTWGFRGALDYLKRIVYYRRMRAYFFRNARRHPLTPRRGITIIADITAPTSLSKVIRDLILMLKKADIPFQTFDLGEDKTRIPSADFAGLLTPKSDFRILEFDHVVEMFGGPYPGGLPLKRSRIVFWEFESGLTDYYPAVANGVDEIIAMSDFNAETFRSQLPAGVKIRKLLYPFMFDAGELPAANDVRARYGIGLDEFVVFFNFDFGSSFGRKNPDGAMRAFAKAFRDVPKTRLVFKTKAAKSHPKDMTTLTQLAAELGVDAKTTFINDFIPMKDVYGLTNACDVYVSLHRGEGFGLGIAEAMSLGKPVIVTDYSAPREFCNTETSIPIPYALVKISKRERDHACYQGVRAWAEADVDAAAAALRRLYEQPDLRLSMGRRAQAFIAEHYSVASFRQSIEAFLA